MAKALYGHVGGPDEQILAQLAALRARVRDLQDEVARLSAANDALTTLVAEEHLTGHLDTVELPVELPAEVSVATPAALTSV